MSRGHYSRQSDLGLIAELDGEVAGHIDYSLYDGEIAVQFIEVAAHAKRQGIATALLRRLQGEYPGVEIDWGMLTDDGAKLRASVPMEDVDDPLMRRQIDLLPRLRAKLADVEARMNGIIARGQPLDQRQWAEVTPLNGMMNRLHDMITRLERATYGKSRSKGLIRAG